MMITILPRNVVSRTYLSERASHPPSLFANDNMNKLEPILLVPILSKLNMQASLRNFVLCCVVNSSMYGMFVSSVLRSRKGEVQPGNDYWAKLVCQCSIDARLSSTHLITIVTHLRLTSPLSSTSGCHERTLEITLSGTHSMKHFCLFICLLTCNA